MSLTFVAYHEPETPLPPTFSPPDDLPPMPPYIDGYDGRSDDERGAATSDRGTILAVVGIVVIALLAVVFEQLYVRVFG